MRLLDRYVCRQFIRNVGLSWLALGLFYLVQALFSDLFERKYQVGHLVIYHFLGLPQILLQICGPSVLLATVMTLLGLSQRRELIALYAMGVGLRQIMLLIVGIVLILGAMLYYFQNSWLPVIYKNRVNYHWKILQKKADFSMDVKWDKVWYRSKKSIYNIEHFEPEGRAIYGMSIFNFDDHFRLQSLTRAARARYEDPHWIMLDGSTTTFVLDGARDFPQTRHFKRQHVLIQETPADFREMDKEVDSLGFAELRRYIARLKQAGINVKRHEVKYYFRFSLCIIPLVMTLLAVPFSTASPRRGGSMRSLGVCLVIAFFYWLFYAVSLSLGTNGVLSPFWAAWCPSLLFGGLTGILMFHHRRYGYGPT